ncbi:hypothetical protein LQW54_007837 [Pestalotiopsis sp. IQ-011]
MALEATPAAGFRFCDLPTEIRHHIWDIAARREAEDLLIFCKRDYTINPTRQLVSALLSATAESRLCALRVFNLPLKLPNDGMVHINLELSSLAGNCTMIRRYACCPAFRPEARKAFLPTSPGPWRRGLTPVSSVIPVEQRHKATRLVVVHLTDGPDHQGLLHAAFPEGPTGFRPEAGSEQRRIYFFNLRCHVTLATIFHELDNMGWKELNQMRPEQIEEWIPEDAGGQ